METLFVHRMWTLIVSVGVAVAFLPDAGAVDLVRAGKTVSYMQLSHHASLIERRAAREISYAVELLTGGGVPAYVTDALEMERNRGRTEIVVRTLDEARRLVPDEVCALLAAKKSPEAYVYATRNVPDEGEKVFIVGKTDMALFYGAVAFVEDCLGVLYLHPGKVGTAYRRRKDVTVAAGLTVCREPIATFRRQSTWFGCVAPLNYDKDVRPYQERRTFMYKHSHPAGPFSHPDDETMASVIKGGEKDWAGGETMLSEGVPLSLFEKHPEYFPLIGGQRSRAIGEKMMRRCLSNPEVQNLCARYALCHIRRSPYFSIDYRDFHGGWCECAACRAYGTGKDGVYSVPNLAHRFTKELSERIFAVVPEAKIRILVYRDYREKISTDVRFDRRVQVLYCPHQRCYAHPLTAPCNAYFRDLYEFWNERSPSFGLFDYYCYSNVPYCPVEYALAEDFRYYAKSNFSAWLEDTSCGLSPWPYPVANWQMYYLSSKMLWDPSLDEKRLLESAYDLYYGPAAAVMKRYHARRLALWNACPAHASMSNFFRPAYCLQPDGSAAEMRGYLDEAKEMVEKWKGGAVEKYPSTPTPLCYSTFMVRIGIDRDLFEKIWVKSNDELRQAKRDQKPIAIARRAGKIVIDGELDDAGWKDAFRVPDFTRVIVDYSGKKHAPQPPIEVTRVRAAYDDDAWYVAYEAMLDATNTPVVANCTKRDDSIWEDDSIELYVNPPYDGYYHFVVNAKGVLYDAEGQSNKHFDSGAEVKAKLLKDRFVVEMRVPVKNMKRDGIRKGESWNIHFARNDMRFGTSEKPVTEVSSLDAIWPHAATKFRRVDIK